MEMSSQVEAPDTRDLHTRIKLPLRYRVIRDLKLALVASRFRAPRKLGALHQLFEMQAFLHSSGLISSPSFQHRSQLYDYVCSQLIGTEAIDFLEFGVFKAASIRQS